MSKNAYFVPNPSSPNKPVVFDSEVCDGCNKCVDACRTQVLMPNPKEGKPPLILYPDECWYGGCCVEACPKEEAIEMVHPLNQRVGWKRKDTGEYIRIGMKNSSCNTDKE